MGTVTVKVYKYDGLCRSSQLRAEWFVEKYFPNLEVLDYITFFQYRETVFTEDGIPIFGISEYPKTEDED